MCVAFTMWLYLAEDQHPGALRALACGIEVDPEPLVCPFCGEPDPCACMSKRETPAEREKQILKELGYDPK